MKKQEPQQPDNTQAPIEGASLTDEALLSVASRIGHMGGWVIDLATKRVSWSKEVAAIHGEAPATNPTLQQAINYFAPEWREHIRRLITNSARDGAPFDEELQIITTAGHRTWVRMIGEPQYDAQGNVVRLRGALQAISDVKQAQSEARRKDSLLRIAGRAARIGGWAVELPDHTVYWSDELCDILDYPPGVVPPLDEALELYPQPSRQHVTTALTKCLEKGTPFNLELEIFTAKKRRIWVYCWGQAERDARGKIIRAHGAFQDITAQHRAQRALEINEERFKLVAAATTDAVWDWDLIHDTVWWNEGFETLFGYSRDEVESDSRSWTNRIHPDDKERVLHSIHAAIDGQENNWEAEYRFVRKDDSVAYVLDRGFTIRNPQGKAIRMVGGMRDLTEKHIMQERLLRAQRLESLGTLAGGIAHDLNNVLSPILLSIPLLKNDARDEQEVRRLELLETSVKRGVDMVRQVLTFARGADGQRVRFAAANIVQDVASLMRETLPRNIQTAVSMAAEPWPIEGDPTHLHQVLLNLCVNARDAMPDGGTLTITADNLHLDEQYAAMNPEARPGPFVLLTVSDTGTGIAPDNLKRIFDPFYTTKELGQGTGLGLSTVQGIIKSYGGFVTVYSELNKGTVFKVYLPAGAPGPIEAASPIFTRLPRGDGETVLVVDDEMAVRLITQEVLHAYGYNVLLAEDGAEALSIYAQQRDKIDVVLTDMMMPVMDGFATIQALLRINPAVKIIAASGLAANGMVAKAAGAGIEHFLPKPYTAEAMLKMLHQILRLPTGS